MTTNDPTAPLAERTPDQIGEFIQAATQTATQTATDIIMALVARRGSENCPPRLLGRNQPQPHPSTTNR